MLSALRVVPIERIFLHEEYESERLKSICKRIKDEQKLKNPPIALQISKEKYLILDGAHRTSSLQELNCKRMVVQVVESELISIDSWAHYIPNDKNLIADLKKNNNLYWSDTPNQENDYLAIVTIDGIKQYVYSKLTDPSDLFSMVHTWKQIVNVYTDKYKFQRISNDELKEDGIVIHYPSLSLQQIAQVVDEGILLPAGVTKFTINCGRFLNLNIPLSFIIREDYVEEDWKELLKLWGGSIRLYTDPIYLCEI
ncbi:hypothetical protein FT637_29560 [Bacillus cereus]|uniref:ParB N-terminal domain-containing protein n=1 Tax=Bacillus cereus TaxID=1396 RepID=UPI00187AE1B4|nr:ParB N-terminal domain-containing protein [Bacillus cereus]MBE7106969.1 hypothetical protein [Bacillus cereus]